jgi:hypothetical protein
MSTLSEVGLECLVAVFAVEILWNSAKMAEISWTLN